jgi:hypothetical protein
VKAKIWSTITKLQHELDQAKARVSELSHLVEVQVERSVYMDEIETKLTSEGVELNKIFKELDTSINKLLQTNSDTDFASLPSDFTAEVYAERAAFQTFSSAFTACAQATMTDTDTPAVSDTALVDSSVADADTPAASPFIETVSVAQVTQENNQTDDAKSNIVEKPVTKQPKVYHFNRDSKPVTYKVRSANKTYQLVSSDSNKTADLVLPDSKKRRTDDTNSYI